jgi:hypothetical protein
MWKTIFALPLILIGSTLLTQAGEYARRMDSIYAARTIIEQQKTIDSLRGVLLILSVKEERNSTAREFYGTELQNAVNTFGWMVACLIFVTGIVAYFNFRIVAKQLARKEAIPIVTEISKRIAKKEIGNEMIKVDLEIKQLYVNTFESFRHAALLTKDYQAAYWWSVRAAERSPEKKRTLTYLRNAITYLKSQLFRATLEEYEDLREPLVILKKHADQEIATLAGEVDTELMKRFGISKVD